MDPVREVQGTAVPLDRSDVDTDAIIPAVWMKRVERTGFEDGLFLEWKKDRAFVLNQPQYSGASILLAGPNFGCGSSREHAPWALRDGGFKAVISPKFADIFRGNCLKIGLLPVVLPWETVQSLMRAVEAAPTTTITIDVAALTVTAPDAGVSARFEMDEFMRWRLLEGMDDISVTLTHADDLAAYEQTRYPWLPATATK